MSLTELIYTNDSKDSQHQSKKSILKSSQSKINQSLPRLDWAGNEIIKGGSHKIAFISQLNTPRTFMDILSNEILFDQHKSQLFNDLNTKNNVNNYYQHFLTVNDFDFQKSNWLIKEFYIQKNAQQYINLRIVKINKTKNILKNSNKFYYVYLRKKLTNN